MSLISEFKAFAVRGNVVDMAVGIIIGAAFTAIIQLGTETAVLIYFWNDITRIIGKWFRALAGKVPHSDPDVRMGWLVILGSIPIGVLGLLFEDQIDHSLRNLYITATMLILFGLLLGLADKVVGTALWIGPVLADCEEAN